MWTWEQERRPKHREGTAQLGRVTLTGENMAASLGGERRWLMLCAPGGYAWMPAEGEQVLILKAEEEGEVPCLVGAAADSAGLRPGQVRLRGGQCALLLGDTLDITGAVTVNGEGLEDYIRRIAGGNTGG